MRKSVGSFIVLNRPALLLTGAVLSLTVFGIVAWQSSAQSNTDNNTSSIGSVMASPTLTCTIGTWQPKAPMVAHVQGSAATSDGTVAYDVGGFDNDGFVVVNGVRRYDQFDAGWTSLAPLPTAVAAASAVYAPNTNKIYVFGGTDSSFGTTNITQIYDITGNTWSLGANMPRPRKNMAAGYYNGKMYLTGGDNGSQVETDMLDYDPQTGVFNTTRQPIPTGADGPGFGVTTDGHLILAGGQDANNAATKKTLITISSRIRGRRKAICRPPLIFRAVLL